jgi:tRNA threonylcarbamoyladenosine biosynthesis protein TsaB
VGWIAIGDGFAAYPALRARLAAAMPVDATMRPTAGAIARLAARGDGRLTDAASAAPEYVRDKVALTTAERARGACIRPVPWTETDRIATSSLAAPGLRGTTSRWHTAR